jgi:hypothetical protein
MTSQDASIEDFLGTGDFLGADETYHVKIGSVPMSFDSLIGKAGRTEMTLRESLRLGFTPKCFL